MSQALTKGPWCAIFKSTQVSSKLNIRSQISTRRQKWTCWDSSSHVQFWWVFGLIWYKIDESQHFCWVETGCNIARLKTQNPNSKLDELKIIRCVRTFLCKRSTSCRLHFIITITSRPIPDSTAPPTNMMVRPAMRHRMLRLFYSCFFSHPRVFVLALVMNTCIWSTYDLTTLALLPGNGGSRNSGCWFRPYGSWCCDST